MEKKNVHRKFAGKGWAAMNRIGWAGIFFGLALGLLAAGCGGTSTGNSRPLPKPAHIAITVQDEAGNPLSGFEVFTAPATVTAVTDSSGKVSLGEVAEGNYYLTVRKDGYVPLTRICPASEGYTLEVTITYFPRVSIIVRDDRGIPVSGATIASSLAVPEKVLDSNGHAEFANIPETGCDFSLKRDRYPETWIRGVSLKPSLVLTVESAAPQIAILTPGQNAGIASTHNIRFTGTGNDIEDGELPDQSLVWYSDKSGELGKGRELVVGTLPQGDHIITLAGTDSDGKRTEVSVSVRIFDYYLDTYFPLPVGVAWDYRVLEPEFYVTDRIGGTEFWSIKQMQAKIEEGPVRSITMRYDVARGAEVYHCVYTLADRLQTDNKNIYITSTVEQYTESLSSEPLLKMGVETRYVPRYLLFRNFEDISAEKTWTSKSDINVVWNYTYYNKWGSFAEWETINPTFSLGEEQSVQTDAGTFPARELTIQDKGITKKWMLSKGLGIILIDDSACNPKLTAVLHDSSLMNIVRKPSGPAVSPATASPPRYDLRIDRRDPRDVRRLCRFLSGMGAR